MADRAFLATQSDGIDIHFGGERTPFLGKASYLASNHTTGNSTIEAVTEGSYNKRFTFMIPQDADYISNLDIVTDFGAISSAGATGGSDYPRNVDWFGFAAYEEIVFRWNANRLQGFTGDDLMILHALSYRSDDSQAALVGGDLQADTATRSANALAASYVTYTPLDLCLFFGGAPNEALPYNIEIFRDAIRVDVTVRPLTSLIETDGTNITGEINSMQLYIQRTHVIDLEQSKMAKYLTSETPALNLAAPARLTTVQEHQNDVTIAANTDDQTIKLTGARPTKELIFYVRNDADLPDGSIKSDIQHYNFQEVDSYKLEGINRVFQERRTGKWNKYRHTNRFHSGDPSLNIYTISHSLAPEAKCDQWGYINYGLLNQPKITVKMAAAAAGKINFLYQTHNAALFNEGDLRMLQI